LAFADFGQEQVTITTATTGSNTTARLINDRTVTFIFRTGFTGTINGAAFTSSDVPLILKAQDNSTVGPVTYVVTAGTLIVVEQKRQ